MLNEIIGKLITDGKRVYRIYYCSNFIARLIVCMTEGTEEQTFDVQSYDVTELRNLILDGKFVVVDESPASFVDPSTFEGKVKEQYEKASNFIHDVNAVYGPEYFGLKGKKSKPDWNELVKKYNLPNDVAWKYVRRYIQSGMNMNAVADKRKLPKPKSIRVGTLTVNPGPKDEYSYVLTEQDVKYMDEEIELLLADNVGSIAYHRYNLLNRHYLKEDGSLKEEYPSYIQFHNHYVKTVPREVRDKRTMESTEAENSYRLKLGSGRLGVERPGQYIEVDACELDVLIVSSVHKDQIIGRPVLYLAVDVYSRAIVGMSVLLYNNSYLGISSLLINIFEGSKKYCERYGVTKGFEYIPSEFCPENLKSDQGAEYTSGSFEKLCLELGTMHDLLPARFGSYKGGVERSFGFIQEFMRPHLRKKGLITKSYTSDHKTTACYTLYEITQMCINEVIFHNSNVVSKLKLSREMKLAISPKPVEIWKYGVENFGAPIPITDANRNAYFYKCLVKYDALVEDDGIHVEGLTYYENTPDINAAMYKASYAGKTREITVGIDQRDCGHIYYNNNGKIIPIPLIAGQIGNEYYNVSWSEYFGEKACVVSRKKKDERDKDRNRAAMHSNNDEILAAAEVSDYKPKTKGITEARTAEKALTAADERLYERMGFETSQIECSVGELDLTDVTVESALSELGPIDESSRTAPTELSVSPCEVAEEDLSNLSLSEIRKRNQGDDAVLKAIKDSKHINY